MTNTRWHESEIRLKTVESVTDESVSKAALKTHNISHHLHVSHNMKLKNVYFWSGGLIGRPDLLHKSFIKTQFCDIKGSTLTNILLEQTDYSSFLSRGRATCWGQTLCIPNMLIDTCRENRYCRKDLTNYQSSLMWCKTVHRGKMKGILFFFREKMWFMWGRISDWQRINSKVILVWCHVQSLKFTQWKWNVKKGKR